MRVTTKKAPPGAPPIRGGDLAAVLDIIGLTATDPLPQVLNVVHTALGGPLDISVDFLLRLKRLGYSVVKDA